MNICVTVNSKYMRYTYVMLQSLYENNEEGSIDLYVLHRDFTTEDKKAIESISRRFNNRVHFIWMDPKQFDNMPLNLIEGSSLSLEIFFRLLIPDTLTMLDKVLMLDVDVVINGSLRELYDIDLNGFCLAAAPNLCTGQRVPMEFRSWYPENRTRWIHFNTGVLLWNLKYIREKFSKNYIFEQAQKCKIETMAFEEELFNVLFGENEILELDPLKWNYITTFENIFQKKFRYDLKETVEELEKNHTIIHFLGSDPWGSGLKNRSYYLWWEYAEKTPYYQDVYRKQIEKLEEEKKSLGYKTMLVEMLFRLKGTGRLKEILSNREIRYIYLYGAGVMAELFYSTLCAEQIQAYVVGVYDRTKRGKFQGMPIEYPDAGALRCIGKTYRNEKSAVIVTPSYETSEIKEELLKNVSEQVEVLTLEDLLK